MKYTQLALALAVLLLGGAGIAMDGSVDISEVQPQEFTVDEYSVLWVTVDPAVVSCSMLISSIDRGEMMYNSALDRWQFPWTFDDSRAANSLRARCTDTEGDVTTGPVIVAPVENIVIDPGDEEPDEVDATEWDAEEIIATSPVLIKTPCPGGEDFTHPCRTVYFLDSLGHRHAFPNEKAYFTWYDDWSNIHVISEENMADFPLSGNVRYKPGVKMIKFPSLNTVYAVARFGVLRPIASETAASDLYGADWNQQIDDVSEAFYFNYIIGDELTHAIGFDKAAQEASVSSINNNLVEMYEE